MADETHVPTNKPQYGIGTIVKHPKFGVGRIGGYDNIFYVVYFKGDIQKVPFSYLDMKAVSIAEDPDYSRMKQAVMEVLGDQGWAEVQLELGSRWLGGSLRLIPGKEDAQPKDIPIEAFFKKIIGVREKLRVLEQKINNHPRLEQADKLDLESYITRCYGSLTTFNVLFADKTGHFVGSGKGRDDED